MCSNGLTTCYVSFRSQYTYALGPRVRIKLEAYISVFPHFHLSNIDRCPANERRAVTTNTPKSYSEEIGEDTILRLE